MKTWVADLSHNKDEGTYLTIREASLASLVLQDVGDSVFGLLNWAHRDWMYSLRWGKADPQWGFADKSAGSKLHDLAQWAGGGFGSFRRDKDIAHLPVTRAWVREHCPDAGWPWNEPAPGDDVPASNAGDTTP
jgi:hypothetical protein